MARAAALLDAGDVEAGALALDALPAAQVVSYQPYWVTRARVAELRGDLHARRDALERALGLTEDPAVRRFLHDLIA